MILVDTKSQLSNSKPPVLRGLFLYDDTHPAFKLLSAHIVDLEHILKFLLMSRIARNIEVKIVHKIFIAIQKLIKLMAIFGTQNK